MDREKLLRVWWSKRENDIIIDYPDKSDGWLLHNFLHYGKVKELLKELESRGYDISTFRLSIKRK